MMIVRPQFLSAVEMGVLVLHHISLSVGLPVPSYDMGAGFFKVNDQRESV